MKLIYIAGPFTAKPGHPVEGNVRAAEALAVTLVRLYGTAVLPVVPHSIGRVLFGIQSETAALAGALELMRRCDAVLLVPGWRDSSGTRAEVNDALVRDQPVFDVKDLTGQQPTKFGRWLAESVRPQPQEPPTGGHP